MTVRRENPLDGISRSGAGRVCSKVQSLKSKNGNQELVRILSPTDVLMGRGNGPNDHIGNGAFRKTIEARLGEYVGTISRKAKDKIALRVVRTVKAQKGRFVKKLKKYEKLSRGIAPEETVYITVDDAAAVTKSKQAFRYVHKASKHLGLDASSSSVAAMQSLCDTLIDTHEGCAIPHILSEQKKSKVGGVGQKQVPKYAGASAKTASATESGQTIDNAPEKLSKSMTNIDLLSSVAIALERLDSVSYLEEMVQRKLDQLNYTVANSRHTSSVGVPRASLFPTHRMGVGTNPSLVYGQMRQYMERNHFISP